MKIRNRTGPKTDPCGTPESVHFRLVISYKALVGVHKSHARYR